MEQNWKIIDRNMAISEVKEPEKLKWFDPRKEPFKIFGFYWLKENKNYWRLPETEFDILLDAAPGVYFMAKDSAGGQIAFETDAERIVVRAEVETPQRWDHMPATCEMGMDCYVAYPGEDYMFDGVTRIDAHKNSYTCQLVTDPGRELKRVIINMPLYMPLLKVEIGLPDDAYIGPSNPFEHEKPIVIYGTSITQGGCVSRPGVLITNVLSRRLKTEFINLGFSGSGKGEPEVADIVSSIIDPEMFILDYEANALERIYENMLPLVEKIRKNNPVTPIIIQSRVFGYSVRRDRERFQKFLNRREFQKKLVEDLKAAGDEHIYFSDGLDLMENNNGDCYVDKIHPNDYGAAQIANGMERMIKEVRRLEAEKSK
ncbi:MAG: SGNH/GDSL hydrolase family protein [Eubacteriales bacterium]|nr:SGNH/GDSL hydrolase family protein [Eubacteriales bacterium]